MQQNNLNVNTDKGVIVSVDEFNLDEIEPAVPSDSHEQSEIEWPDPQPLVAEVERKPYPTESLPDGIRDAVQEVQAFLQAPVALCASSALGVLSVAAQSYVNVERARGLSSPSSLFLLAIAKSGERKTTSDNYFTAVLHQYDREQAKAMKPELEHFKAEWDSWKADRDGLLSAIKDARKRGKPNEQKKLQLAELQKDEPKKPRVPLLMLDDETPENLRWRLMNDWPSAGIMSNEGGTVLGSHGMGQDSITRNLALYNKLWDGSQQSVGRKNSESFVIHGVRLSMSVQVQPKTFVSFNEKSGNIGRDNGFFARFLIAWPESNMGDRPFTDQPEHLPKLDAFHDRILEILSVPITTDSDGHLTPVMLKFESNAFEDWKAFYNTIESKIKDEKKKGSTSKFPNSESLSSIDDIASKAADNAARLAALFHVYANGTDGSIGADSLRSACAIVEWHLYEAKRVFSEKSPIQKTTKLQKLDGFLIEYCNSRGTDAVTKSDTMRNSPIREVHALNEAIGQLAELGRLRIEIRDKSTVLVINPKLLA